MVLLPALGFVAPIPLLCVAVLAAFRPGRRPGAVPFLAELAAIAALALAAAGAMQVVLQGPDQAVFLMQDAVSATMVLLVAFIGWVILRYSRRYLDGEAREGAFYAALLATLVAVLLLVQAANLIVLILGFMAVGVGMRSLLLFYRERPEARRAAAKFSLVWGAGDVVLVAATLLCWFAFGTTQIAALTSVVGQDLSPLAVCAVALIVMAAVLKTATFPLHGWLTEVMEAPTPVSALLHAGIISAGGVMLLRLAGLVQASPGAMAALVMIGGFTALFGAAVMLTQSAAKTALAWSTVAQMGFMLLQCGLGLWTLAMLHIVVHALYKAHAFLSAGEAVRAVADSRKPGPVAAPGFAAVGRAFAIALVLYVLVAGGFGLIAGAKSAQALALGAILIFGVAYLIAQGLADAAPRALTRRTTSAALAAAIAYFALHWLAGLIWGGHLPHPPSPGPLEWALIVLALMSFGLVAVAQSLFPLWSHHPAAAGLRVHLANGLYLNAVLDRLIGGFRTQKTL